MYIENRVKYRLEPQRGDMSAEAEMTGNKSIDLGTRRPLEL